MCPSCAAPPILAQLFLVFYGSGQFRPELQALGLWHFFREPFNCAVLVFAINSCAYQTEIMRGGIQSVPPGEIEAARAIGMTRWQVLRRVIFPHIPISMHGPPSATKSSS